MVVGLVLAVVVLSGVYSHSAGAQAANTLRVSPVRSDVTINPGETGTVDITITNLTSNDILVAAIQNDFVQGDENGTPSIILDEDEYASTHSLKRFMTPLQNVTVPANESVIVPVEIVVPADAQAGGYFGALRFAPTTPDSGGQVNLSASVASLILLTVPGPTTEVLNLTDFSVSQGTSTGGLGFRSGSNMKINFRFENKGNIQLGPFGKISVLKGDEVVFDYDFNNKNPRDVILPDGARKWEVAVDNIEGFGYYTVHGTFTYGSENKTIEVERSFWVIPTAFIIGAVIALLVIAGGIVGLIFWLKGRRSRAIRRRAGRRR